MTVAAITRTIPKKSYPQNVALAAGPLPEAGTILRGQLMTVDKSRLGAQPRGALDPTQVAHLNRALRLSLGL